MPKTVDLYAAFVRALSENGMAAYPSVLIALSGGADSVVLLDLYDRYRQETDTCLFAWHLDHGIRSESAEDAAFCQALCRERKIPFFLSVEDIPTYAESRKLGLEEAARERRYQLLESLRQSKQIAVIATAHNATDNVETVLHRLTRGSSLTGAAGIPPKRDHLIRPLLPFSKSEILAYAEEQGLSFCHDKTNEDIRYTRNRIRHKILPELRAVNPTLEQSFSRFAEDAREDDAFLYALARPYADSRDTRLLASLAFPLFSRALLIKYRRSANNEITREHVKNAYLKIKAAANGEFSGRLPFPGELSLCITPTVTVFENNREKPEAIAPIPLLAALPLTFGKAFVITVSDVGAPSAMAAFSLPQAALSHITVRTRLSGDTYRQGGMTRRIKKLLCDAKMPQSLRSALPIFLYDDEILFVPTLPPSDRLRTLLSEDGARYQILIEQVYSHNGG